MADHNNTPYDPYIPSGNAAGGAAGAGNNRTAALQAVSDFTLTTICGKQPLWTPEWTTSSHHHVDALTTSARSGILGTSGSPVGNFIVHLHITFPWRM